jgi:hypothetical protein
MSQFPHDEFAKEYLPELIKDYGEAKSGENVNAERREIDVFFQPTKEVPTLTGRQNSLKSLLDKEYSDSW